MLINDEDDLDWKLIVSRVLTKPFENKVKLDLSNFLYGVYTIKIIFKNDTFVTKKIIKK